MASQATLVRRARPRTGLRRAAVVTALRDDLDLMIVDAIYADGSPERYQVIVEWDVGQIAEYAADRPHRSPTVRAPDTTRSTIPRPRHLLSLFDERRSGASGVHQGTRGDPAGATNRRGCPARNRATPAWSSAGDAIIKVFRRVTPGIDPDIELNRVLGRGGNQNVARLLGHFETHWEAKPNPLGMVSGVCPRLHRRLGHGDGSARDLYAGEVGGDFAGESYRLGEAVASVHAALALRLGTSRVEFPVGYGVAATRLGRVVAPGLARTSRPSRSGSASCPVSR